MENFKTSNFAVEEINTKEAANINGGCDGTLFQQIGCAIANIVDQIEAGFDEEWNSG